MLMTLRGVPVIYYGDEQGFAGSGGDQDARQDMFASKTATYNAERLIGTSGTTAQSHFGADHPLYKAISTLAMLRRANAALREGDQVVRAYARTPGIFAVSRLDAQSNTEILIAFNTSKQAIDVQVEVDPHSQRFRSLRGNCAPAQSAPGSYRVQVPALDYLICASAAAP
jgi:glycosidase